MFPTYLYHVMHNHIIGEGSFVFAWREMLEVDYAVFARDVS